MVAAGDGEDEVVLQRRLLVLTRGAILGGVCVYSRPRFFYTLFTKLMRICVAYGDSRISFSGVSPFGR